MRSAVAVLSLILVSLFAVPVSHASEDAPVHRWRGHHLWREQRLHPASGDAFARSDPAVPEPSAALVFGVGLLTIAGATRRRKRVAF